MFIQIFCKLMKLSDIVLQNLQSFLVLHFHQIHNLLVQKCLCFKGACKAGISSQILVGNIFHSNHIEILTHTISGNHSPGNLGSLLNIIGSSCGNGMENKLLCCTSACKGSNLILQFFLCHKVMVTIIYLHSISQGT